MNNENNTHQQSLSTQSHGAKNKIKSLLKKLTEGLYEREQIISIALLGAISGQNTFLYGPPGTAKSLISRRLASAFKEPIYFEHLMNRFSSPEDVFGPVSIKALKEDSYIRKIEGYLPTANFAFLDEIWKSSPAILNSLLTLINEHKFKNGNQSIDVPLKSLIAASNEVPLENQGLDALYDRFILRLPVLPITEEKNFNNLLNSKPTPEKLTNIKDNITISYQELENWQQQIYNVELSTDTLMIIKIIKNELAERFEELKAYVSDRRWQRAAILLKASAFCNGRNKTNHSDVILLKHCLWTSPENRQIISDIVMKAIEDNGFISNINLSDLDNEKESLDREINNELYHNEDVYDVMTLPDGKEYFKVNARFESRYYGPHVNILHIPYTTFKTKEKKHPVDINGNELKQYTCQFDGQGTCTILYKDRDYNNILFKPTVLCYKGDKKKDINTRLISSLKQSIIKIRKNLNEVLTEIKEKNNNYKLNLESHFVTNEETDVAIKGIIEQTQQIKIRIKDCERLESLCK